MRLAGEDDDYQHHDDDDNDDNEQEVATTNPDDNDDDGEDLLESLERDYQHIPEPDTYGTEGVDDQDYAVMTAFMALSCGGMTAATRSKRKMTNKDKMRRAGFARRGDGHGEEED